MTKTNPKITFAFPGIPHMPGKKAVVLAIAFEDGIPLAQIEQPYDGNGVRVVFPYGEDGDDPVRERDLITAMRHLQHAFGEPDDEQKAEALGSDGAVN